ncbi:DUF7710 domain-containing protein [Acinetobacter piscicola]|uniref:DUF7710 domain-containing protein n=1 Tax=Acinetobacter piscicola TaxID=2006115 RepID=UPI000B7CACBB|nr:hypothetical protein [Acinetobacter piscicola]
MKRPSVFLFQAENASYTSAVFSSYKLAQTWVYENGLSGVIMEYPLDVSSYDWSISKNYFKVKSPIDKSPVFIGSFVSTYQLQWHFQHGRFIDKFSSKLLKTP